MSEQKASKCPQKASLTKMAGRKCHSDVEILQSAAEGSFPYISNIASKPLKRIISVAAGHSGKEELSPALIINVIDERS